MGSRMAINLLKAGYEVTVWNRTPEAAQAVLAEGAHWASTPRQAAQHSDVVISMVRDDAVSRIVWLDSETGALSGMGPQAIAIESSTLTPAWIKTLAAEMASKGTAFLEAPVSGSRPQAAAATLVYFVGGDEAVLACVRDIISTMGAAIYHTGNHGSAALTKLATNTLMGVQVTALAEIIGLLEHEGADIARTLNAVSGTACWSPFASGASASMVNQAFAPQFPASLIEKDFSYFLKSAPTPNAAPTLQAARDVFRRGMENGIGEENMTGVVRLFTADKHNAH